MKYEITKGSEKDFEGAPEWALYIDTCRRTAFASEGYEIGNRYVALTGHQEGTEFVVDSETNPPDSIIAERRPITEPVVNQQLTTEWSGEGLPPVGVECESLTGGEWRKVMVCYIGEPGTHVEALVFDVKSARPFWADQFRPIRSPEDVARDEAIKAMRAALGHAAGLIEVSNIYRAIAAGKIPGIKLEAL